MGLYLPLQAWCLVVGDNITWFHKTKDLLHNNDNLFTVHLINEDELFLNKNFVLENNTEPINACFNDFLMFQNKEYAVLDWDEKTSIIKPDLLQKSVYTLSVLNCYLYKKNKALQSENDLLLCENNVSICPQYNTLTKAIYIVFVCFGNRC